MRAIAVLTYWVALGISMVLGVALFFVLSVLEWAERGLADRGAILAWEARHHNERGR